MILHSRYVINLGVWTGHFLCIFWWSVFSFYINLISSSFVEDFWCPFLALNWSQGLLGHHCFVRASKCPHGSCLYFGFNPPTAVFKTTSRSTFPYWESQRFQVPGLSDSEHVSIEGIRGDAEAPQWQVQQQAVEQAASADRPQHIITPGCLGPLTSTQQLQGSPGPRWFFKMPLASVSAEGGNAALNSDSQKICRIFFSCHLEAAFFFHSKVFTNQKPGIKPDFMVIFLNLGIYWWKRQRRQKSVSATEHIQTATPRAFGFKNTELFLTRIIKEILIFCSFKSSCLNLLSPVRN